MSQTHNPSLWDVIIVGAGAAGLMCAIEAGKRGRRVLVLDHANKVGKKILISGGGRCNFTNLGATPDSFLSRNPRFCISALTQYTPQDFIALVEKHRIAYHEKKLGQLFCDRSATEIVNMLLLKCIQAKVTVRLECAVTAVSKENDLFRLDTNQGLLTGSALVLATGGLSIPKMGATDFTHRTARQFGLAVTETRPGLVPLLLDAPDLARYSDLAGLSFDAAVTCGGETFRESVLFTHRGLSGPAVLQASSHWREGRPIEIDLFPGQDVLALLEAQKIARSRSELVTVLADHLPKRLAQALSANVVPNRPMGAHGSKDLAIVAQALSSWTLHPTGTEGYRTAEVTLGGVDTNGLSSKTMEAKTVPGLYVIGEAVDVTGPLGGYNFQWAWSSGFAAGQHA